MTYLFVLQNVEMNEYIISLGSNQGQSDIILLQAMKALGEHGAFVTKRSSLYRTKPWGKTDQADFINAVVSVSWEGKPEELLHILQDIEHRFHRKRVVHWGPRTLDLDLIYSKSVSCSSDVLRLPHPYFWQRLFVLVPLEEICPDFTYQGTGIHEQIARLGGYDAVHKIDERKDS